MRKFHSKGDSMKKLLVVLCVVLFAFSGCWDKERPNSAYFDVASIPTVGV
jgi:hypothetical protein